MSEVLILCIYLKKIDQNLAYIAVHVQPLQFEDNTRAGCGRLNKNTLTRGPLGKLQKTRFLLLGL